MFSLKKKLPFNLLKEFVLTETNKIETISDYTTLCMLGKFFLRKNDLKKALFYYSSALKLNENSRKLLVIVGTLYYLNGEESLAKQFFYKTNVLNPNSKASKFQQLFLESSTDVKKKRFYRFSSLVR